MKTNTTILMVCSMALVGCATSTTSSNDAETYLRANDPRFADAFNHADWDTVAAFYADDAVTLMPNADAKHGRAAIRQGFNAMAGLNANLRLTTDRVVQSGDLAYETGTYDMTMSPSGTAPMNDRGKYLTVWRRQADGTWKIVADSINTSLPAPRM